MNLVPFLPFLGEWIAQFDEFTFDGLINEFAVHLRLCLDLKVTATCVRGVGDGFRMTSTSTDGFIMLIGSQTTWSVLIIDPKRDFLWFQSSKVVEPHVHTNEFAKLIIKHWLEGLFSLTAWVVIYYHGNSDHEGKQSIYVKGSTDLERRTTV